MELFGFIYSPLGQFIILLIEIVGTLAFLAIFFTLVFVLRKSSWLKLTIVNEKVIDPVLYIFATKNQKSFGISNIEKKWQTITKRLQSPNPADWKLGIIEAENLAEDVLTRMGIAGQTFGDRLKKMTKAQIPSLDNLTRSHQMRNNIVHDPDFMITLEDARQAIDGYEKALRELEVF